MKAMGANQPLSQKMPRKPATTWLLGNLHPFTNDRLNYLQTLADQYEESGGQLSTAQVLDELFGIVSAGHETTSMALMRCFY